MAHNESDSRTGNTHPRTLGQRVLFWLFLTACCASAFAAVWFVRLHLDYRQKNIDEVKQRLQSKTLQATGQINDILRSAMNAADKLAHSLTTGELDRETMLPALEQTVAENGHFYGGTITFRPFGYDPETKLYSAYYSKSGPEQALEFQRLDEQYDYTAAEYEWYGKPMAEGSRWGEPYWDETVKTNMITYSAVFHTTHETTGEKVSGGVVTIDISMDEIRRVIEGLDLGPFGFAGLTTREGHYLYHPQAEYVRQHKTLLDVAREKNDPDRRLLAEAARRLERGVIDHESTTTGQQSWLIYEPVPISGWSMQNTYIREDFIEGGEFRRPLMLISTALIVFVLTLLSLILRVQNGHPGPLWTLSIASTLMFLGGIAAIWAFSLAHSSTDFVPGKKISDKATMNWVIKSHAQQCRSQGARLPDYVRTGLIIDTIKLEDANDFLVSGSIWQKHPVHSSRGPGSDSARGTAPPFRFANARTESITEVSRRTVNEEEIALWNFRILVRQKLDLSEYPLDQEVFSLGLLPAQFGEPAALVPDLDGYKFLIPSSKPGLDPQVFLSGWKITKTYFELREHEDVTWFGMEPSEDHAPFPVMHYHIVMRRMFLDSFISNLTPLILVAVMLFAILLLSGKIDYGRALSMCVGMLFVIVFSHLGIRNKISVEALFYLEYFYFLIYFAILWVVLNSIREPLGLQFSIFSYRNGLLPRVLYWPFLTGALFVVTFVVFYFEQH